MEEVQAQALQTFTTNMQFFSSYDEKLFHKLSILQQAIESGQYQENYALEYLQDGYFDVKNLHDGSFLYGTNSNEHAKQKADEISFDKLDMSLSLSYKNSYTKEMVDDLEKFSAYNSSVGLMAPIEFVLTKYGGREKEMKKIYKFAFLGLGLGLHVNSIDEKLKARSYLLVEDNLELFYLSCFTCNYANLSKHATLFFCVMENSEGLKRAYDDYFYDFWLRNDFLKFSLFSEEYAYKIKQLQGFAASNPALAYPYNFLLRKNLLLSRSLKSNFRFLKINQIYKNSLLANKKVLLLAAGPSLGKHIEWVKKHRDEFIIIAVFMIAKKLQDNGIKPDIFIHMDENESPIKNTLDKITTSDYFDEVLFVFSGSVPIELFGDIINQENTYFIEDRTRYKVNHGSIEFYSVGEAGYNLALLFGANELYLLGLDLALDQATGQTHTEGHNSSSTKVDTSSASKIQEVGSLKENVLMVAGNRGGKVLTTPLFEASIYVLNKMSQTFLSDQKVFNLGDGALFKGIEPLLVKDVKFDNVSLKDINLKAFLNSISTVSMSKQEQQNLFIRKQELKKKVKFIKRFSQTKPKNIDEFYGQILDLTNILIRPSNEELIEIREVFTSYIMMVGSYLGEYFNTKNAQTSQDILIEIRDTFANQLKKLLYAIGLWEFDFLKQEAFATPLTCKELQEKILDFTLKYQEFPQAKEMCFGEKLKLDKKGELLKNVALTPLKSKNAIGFLATFENLKDTNFLKYLEQILTTLPQATLIAFYFEEYQKAVVEDKFKERATCKEVQGIDDIVNGCRVWLTNSKYLAIDFYIYSFIQKSFIKEIYIIDPCINLKTTLKEHEKEDKAYYDKIYANMEKLGIQDEYSKNKQLIFNQILLNYVIQKFNLKQNTLDENLTFPKFWLIWLKYILQNDDVAHYAIDFSINSYKVVRQ